MPTRLDLEPWRDSRRSGLDEQLAAVGGGRESVRRRGDLVRVREFRQAAATCADGG